MFNQLFICTDGKFWQTSILFNYVDQEQKSNTNIFLTTVIIYLTKVLCNFRRRSRDRIQCMHGLSSDCLSPHDKAMPQGIFFVTVVTRNRMVKASVDYNNENCNTCQTKRCLYFHTPDKSVLCAPALFVHFRA